MTQAKPPISSQEEAVMCNDAALPNILGNDSRSEIVANARQSFVFRQHLFH